MFELVYAISTLKLYFKDLFRRVIALLLEKNISVLLAPLKFQGSYVLTKLCEASFFLASPSYIRLPHALQVCTKVTPTSRMTWN